MKLFEIVYMLIIYVLILWVLRMHIKIRLKIKKWAKLNNFKIIKKRFIPWHNYGFIAVGIHPASFKVTIKDTSGQKRRFSIAGGGIFWLTDEFEVKEIKCENFL